MKDKNAGKLFCIIHVRVHNTFYTYTCIIHFTCTLYNRIFACTEPSLSLHVTVDDTCARLRYLEEELIKLRAEGTYIKLMYVYVE